jgi:putative flippase GtrA
MSTIKFISLDSFQKISKSYMKYLIIGILSNVISFVIFKIFVYIGFGIDFAAAIGMVFGTLNTYTLGRKFIKDDSINHSNKMAAFFIIYYACAIYITSNTIELLGSTGYINYNFAWLICTIAASICNFIFLNNIALKLRN